MSKDAASASASAYSPTSPSSPSSDSSHPTHLSAASTGSFSGRYTFHLPNGWTRQPLMEDSDDGEERKGGTKNVGRGKGLYQPLFGGGSDAKRKKLAAGSSLDEAVEDEDETDEEHAEAMEEDDLLTGAAMDAVREVEEARAAGEGEVSGAEGLDWTRHPSMTRIRKSAVLAAFVTLGAAVLLPFNALITPTEFYRILLSKSSVAGSFMSWILLVYNLSTILLGAHATVSLHKTTPARRIYTASGLIVLCLLLLTVFTLQATPSKDGILSGNVAFAVLVAGSFVIAGSVSYHQNAVVSLCSIFGARAMGLMLAGQGLVGLVSSVVQLVAAYQSNAKHPGPHPPGPPPHSTTAEVLAAAMSRDAERSDYYEQTARAATAFFTFSTVFMLLAFLSFVWLSRLRIYSVTCQGYESAKQGSNESRRPRCSIEADEAVDGSLSLLAKRHLPASSQHNALEMIRVQRKVLPLALSIFFIFTVTLAAFPALTARVSSNDVAKKGWRNPFIFVSWHFVAFNGSDLVGRTLPTLSPRLVFKSTRTIIIATILRVVFIPLFMACNVRPPFDGPDPPPSSGKAAANSNPLSSAALPDWVFFLLVVLFGLTNGFIATSIFIAGPSSDKLSNDSQRAMAGAVLSFWLTLGLAAGSVASFAIGVAV